MADDRYGYGERDWRRGYEAQDRRRRYGEDQGQQTYGGREQRSFGEESRGGRYGGYRGSDYGDQDYGASDVRGGYQEDGGRGYRSTSGYGEDYGSSRSGGMGGGMSGQYGREGGARNYGRGQSYGQSYGQGGGYGQDYGAQERSWFGTGEHRGRGPKGYKRSDERIREDVNDRLTDDPILDASDIEVKVQNCEVTLEGKVGAREERRRAEMLVEQCSGVEHVQNNLRVQRQEYSAGQGGARQGGLGQNEVVNRVTEGKDS